MSRPVLVRTIILSCATLFAAFACLPLPAQSRVDVAVVDRDSGQWLPHYRYRGDTWLAGIPGHRYAVRLTNTTGERVLVVLSVDGVNAISGEDADPAQSGYVLMPWQSTEIAGWRKSLDDVASFYFTDLPDSYAARTGRADNVGVIGIAVFRQAQPLRDDYPPYPHPYQRPEADARSKGTAAPDTAEHSARAVDSAPAQDRDIARQQIGTGHGTREWAPASRGVFVRASTQPAQITQLRYDTPDRLLALGIGPYARTRQWPVVQAPRAFPNGFVTDPP
ncbi:MAG: hypothetical protein ACOH1R_07500 [Luteimonas sp.]